MFGLPLPVILFQVMQDSGFPFHPQTHLGAPMVSVPGVSWVTLTMRRQSMLSTSFRPHGWSWDLLMFFVFSGSKDQKWIHNGIVVNHYRIHLAGFSFRAVSKTLSIWNIYMGLLGLYYPVILGLFHRPNQSGFHGMSSHTRVLLNRCSAWFLQAMNFDFVRQLRM